MKLCDMKPGLKVVTVEEIDMYPQCQIPIGTTGTITDTDIDLRDGNLVTVTVKLDKALVALSDWNSEIYVFPEDDPLMCATASHFEPRLA